MNDNQQYCINMLSEWVGGPHHLPKVHEFGTGVAINYYGDLSTFDFDRLTRLVILAHQKLIRVEIASSGPGMVKIICHRRRETGPTSKRHATLDDLICKAESALLVEAKLLERETDESTLDNPRE